MRLRVLSPDRPGGLQQTANETRLQILTFTDSSEGLNCFNTNRLSKRMTVNAAWPSDQRLKCIRSSRQTPASHQRLRSIPGA